MSHQPSGQAQPPSPSPSTDETEVRVLYQQILDGWTRRSAHVMASAFVADGEIIGFDGSQVTGRDEIAAHIQEVFNHHATPAYVGKVRSVRFLRPDVALLSAYAGMVPPGQSDLDPKLNTIHTVVAMKGNGQWRVVLFQNTPAQFHGRPELVQQLTQELRELRS